MEPQSEKQRMEEIQEKLLQTLIVDQKALGSVEDVPSKVSLPAELQEAAVHFEAAVGASNLDWYVRTLEANGPERQLQVHRLRTHSLRRHRMACAACMQAARERACCVGRQPSGASANMRQQSKVQRPEV